MNDFHHSVPLETGPSRVEAALTPTVLATFVLAAAAILFATL